MKLYALHNVVFLNDPDNVILRPKFNTYDQALSRLSFVSLLGLPITLGDNLPDLPEDRVELLRRGIPTAEYPSDGCTRDRPRSIGWSKPTWRSTSPLSSGTWWMCSTCSKRKWRSPSTSTRTCTCRWKRAHTWSMTTGTGNILGEIAQSFSISLRPCASKVFAVRKKLGRPQLLSTSRHFSQGAFDLVSLTWDESRDRRFPASPKVVAGDPYEIVLYVPDGYRVFSEGNDTLSADMRNAGKHIWTLRLNPAATGETAWSVAFTAAFPR